MSKQSFAWSAFVALVALFMVACTPKSGVTSLATPTTVPVAPQLPGPIVAPPTSVVTVPTSTPTAAVSPDDITWAKVVDAAKKEGLVNVYSVTFQGDVGQAVSKAFQNRYGIKMEITSGTVPVFLERLKAEKRLGQMTADVLEGGLSTIRGQDLLVSTGDVLPVLREKGVWLVDPTNYDPKEKSYFIFRVIENYPYINTNLLKPSEAPKSWKDLLDPKWKGKMVFMDPALNTNIVVFFVVSLDNKIFNEDYIKALYKQELMITGPINEDLRVLSRGERYLDVFSGDAPACNMINGGAPIQAIDMSEGMVSSGTSNIAAISGGAHPNAARLLLNWLLGAEGQTAYGKARGTQMVRNDIPDFRPPACSAKVTNRIFATEEQFTRGGKFFQDKWFNKLVGR